MFTMSGGRLTRKNRPNSWAVRPERLGAERPILVPDEAVADAQDVGDGLGGDIGHAGDEGQQVEGAQVDDGVGQTDDQEAHGLAGRAVATQERWKWRKVYGWKSRAIC